MKKTYKSLTQAALALLCLGLAMPASAQQRGAEHAQGGGNSGGGSVQPQRSSSPPPSAPAPQPQFQRGAPQAQPQVQRYDPPQQVQRAPQAQPQVQRYDPPQQVQRAPQAQPQVQQTQPQTQRSNPQSNGYNGQQQGNGFGGRQQQPNAANPPVTQRGAERQTPLRFQPNNPNGGSRLYPNGQRGNYNNGFNYRRGNNTAYRSYPGLRFGRNYVSPRPRGFYFNNRGYYRTYYTPQLGFSINTLPYGYYPFYYGTDQYYYSDGLYYTQQDDNYTVVEPPIGAVITKLPAKAQSIAINGMQYYELNGVYYQPITKDDGTVVYQIAGKDGELNTADESAIAPEDLPQVGDLVDHLPEGFRILKLNGQRYYVSQEGYYFQDAVDTDGERVFKIVATPNDTLEN